MPDRHALRRFCADESGQGAVEYALIAGAMVFALFAAASAIKAAQAAAFKTQHEGLKTWRAP
jgi:Flp pilus assembly pilin Flp